MAPGHEFLLAKMQNYCSYQERSLFDVKSKLINGKVQEKVIDEIINELNKKQIPDIYIQIGLQEIDDDEYFNTLKEIISKKDAIIKIADPEKRIQNLANYAISKGYNRGLVWKVLNQTI
jgi:SOS response regulatory protein OraA/RecX